MQVCSINCPLYSSVRKNVRVSCTFFQSDWTLISIECFTTKFTFLFLEYVIIVLIRILNINWRIIFIDWVYQSFWFARFIVMKTKWSLLILFILFAGMYRIDGKYLVLPSGELHIRDVGPEDGYKTYQCRTKHRLTGETRLSATKGRLVITGKSKHIDFLSSHWNYDSDCFLFFFFFF